MNLDASMHLMENQVRGPLSSPTAESNPTEYGLPIDDAEQDRIDLKHRMYGLLMEEKLLLAPIGPNPERILDLGTGSGKRRIVSSFCKPYSNAIKDCGHWI